jgi:hypothetical protein
MKQAESRSLALNTVATFSSETWVDFQWTTRGYIPEDRTLHNHRSENLKSYKQRVTGDLEYGCRPLFVVCVTLCELADCAL